MLTFYNSFDIQTGNKVRKKKVPAILRCAFLYHCSQPGTDKKIILMLITKSPDVSREFNGIDPHKRAASTGNDSGLKDRIEQFSGRSICLPAQRNEVYLEDKGVNSVVPKNDLSRDPEAKPVLSSAVNFINPAPAPPITPVHLDRADPVARDHRSRVGGKAQFLTVMTKAGLPVPAFRVIPHNELQAIDDVVIEPHLLAQIHPGNIDAGQLQSATVRSLKESICTMGRSNQAKWLDALRQLLISDDFLPQVARLPVAGTIRSLYQQLVPGDSNQPVIVRSSGLEEDGFGDAQAGKYESCLHGGGDILKSCLKVLVSAYQPALCRDGTPHPMALVMQSYLDCRFGGVALSHTSLQDDTLQIEYTPGQPRGAVAGTNSLKPHRYQIRRNVANPIQWSQGHVTSHFALKKTAEGFTEEEHEEPSADELPQGIPEQLKRHIVQLENLLGCPVDVEFAVDQQDRLYLVQVRPITALPGAASFSGNPPNQPLCAGELVGEGLAVGEAYYVDKPVAAPSTIPESAIIHAVNADPWMLEPEVINRVGGYVFKNGGNNDHVAIMLKQSGKPCMRSDAPFTGEKPQSPSMVTLIAGNFNQNCGAYLLEGDQMAHWSTRYTKLTLNYAAGLTTCAANKPAAPTFDRVEQGFLWLHAQNQRVLNYFLRGRLFDLCLAPGHNKLLSMSPHRAEVLRALKVEIENFLQDIQYLVEGYERFLLLHPTDAASKPSDRIKVKHLLKFLEDIPLLKEQLATIKSQVQKLANKIIKPMITQQELPEPPIDYEQWLNDGETLINELQQFNQPYSVNRIRSPHDLVFYIHKRFIAALEPVASLSDQGVVEKKGNVVIVHFVSDNSQSLLTEPIKDALNTSGTCAVLNLPTACIANIELGIHACTISMFEHGDGGKGRKLQLVLSDDLDGSNHEQGKLKRFWYLAHAIQLRLAGEGAGNMTSHLNPTTEALTVELRRMESTEAMKEGFLSLTKLLSTINNFDISISHVNISKNPEMQHWDFLTVEKMIRQSQDDPDKNDHAFKYCLFKQGLSQWADNYAPHIHSECSEEHQIFFNAGKSFSTCYLFGGNPSDKIDQWITKVTALHPDAEPIKKELTFILPIVFPNCFKIIFPFIQKNYPDNLTDNNFLKKLCFQSSQLFASLPLALRNNKTFAIDVVTVHPEVFRYAGERIKNDKPTVLAVVQRLPYNLDVVSNTLKEDSDVVLAAVNVRGMALCHAGESLKNNADIVSAAVKNCPMAFQYAGINLKQDKKFVLTLARQVPEILKYLEPEYQDREIALAALKSNINMKKGISTTISLPTWNLPSSPKTFHPKITMPDCSAD